MSSRSLPPRPSLKHLGKQAKTLLKDFKGGVPAAFERLADAPAGSPAASAKAPAKPDDKVTLRDAQRVVAGKYGFGTWAKLKAHVSQMESADMVEMGIDSIRSSIVNYQRVVFLRAMESDRYLPIWIGPAEADSIALKLQNIDVPRPLTHDLLDLTIGDLGAKVEKVAATNIRETTFYASIVLRRCADYYIAIPPLHAYAESADGVHWEKPDLGLIEYQGSKRNNIVWMGPVYDMGVFLDANPDAAADARYKAVSVDVLRDSEGSVEDALLAMASPDGVRWRLMQREPVMSDPPHDTMHCAFWDSRRCEYVMYTRGLAGEGDFTAGVRGVKPGVRWVRWTTSKDFVNWTTPEPIDTGDAPFEHLYTNVCVPYERAPGTSIMFPARYVPERTPDPNWPEDVGVDDVVFMSSRDGLNFDRGFMEAFIRPGLDKRNWHERALKVERGIVQTSPTELSIYATEHAEMPDVHVRRYTLRTDGFVAVNAGYAGGEFVTRPLVFEGRELELNYSTSAVGHVRVEVQDAEGRPHEGFGLDECPHMFGDEIEGVVRWDAGAELGTLAGRPVRLRFELKDAGLFAFRFR